MYIKKIRVKSYGPIEDIEYSFRFINECNPVPLIVIGKNGGGKTLLFTNIIDAIIETKRKVFPGGILEVEDNNYYKIGSHSYINTKANTSEVSIKIELNKKEITYTDIMSKNPEQAIANKEIEDSGAVCSTHFQENGFYKSVEASSITRKEFENDIVLYFPADRFYKPMWYNPENYNRVNMSAENRVEYSTTNLIKIDILDNIIDWVRNVYMQIHLNEFQIPNDGNLPADIRGKRIRLPIDTNLQFHLKNIISVIKGDGQYSISLPNRNRKHIGVSGTSIQCSDISQLSSGELILCSIAFSIIKEWDIIHNDDSVELENISGCVIIDEADANLHIDFAYRALPKLMKLFPKIQFILNTHSPFLLSGLKKEYGNDIDILSMPSGEVIRDLNSFSEINAAYNVFNAETGELLKKVEMLKKENNRLQGLNNKVIIYTEGKTDVKYLKLAFDYIKGYEALKKRIEYYDIENAKDAGDIELDKTFKYLQHGDDTNIKICIFDRDNPKYIFSDKYICGSNNVYKFNIPIPSHRNDDDKISIEHCFTDEEIKTFDSNERRIFMSGEFDDRGVTMDKKYLCHYKMGTNPLEILDGSDVKKVYKIEESNTNYALSKNDFVDHIVNRDRGFDNFSFEGFKPILEMINNIVDIVDNSRNNNF